MIYGGAVTDGEWKISQNVIYRYNGDEKLLIKLNCISKSLLHNKLYCLTEIPNSLQLFDVCPIIIILPVDGLPSIHIQAILPTFCETHIKYGVVSLMSSEAVRSIVCSVISFRLKNFADVHLSNKVHNIYYER